MIKILGKYIHGSEDSTDTDVCYVSSEPFEFVEAQHFCSEDKSENRNIIWLDNNGHVGGCYKGTIDEINNSLLDTYHLHEQSFPMMIKSKVERDIYIKIIRAIRGILSHLSRSQYRQQIKAALRNKNFKDRLEILGDINLKLIDFSTLNKHMSAEDIKKVIAFQIGQCLGLIVKTELYTKSEIGELYPALKQFLYRETNSEIDTLQRYVYILIALIEGSIADKIERVYDLLTETKKASQNA